MQSRHLVVSFTIHEEGASVFTGSGVWLNELLRSEFADGQYVITNPDGHPSWVGRADSQTEAVLKYLKTRCGIGVVDG